MSTVVIILMIVAAIFGAIIDEFSGFVLFPTAVFLLWKVLAVAKKLDELEQSLRVLKRTVGKTAHETAAELQTATAAPPSDAADAPAYLAPHYPPEPEPLVEPVSEQEPRVIPQTPADHVVATPEPIAAAQPTVDTTERREPPYVHQEDIFDRLAGRLKGFFTDGNVFAKIGLLVLFVGIGFLMRYAVVHDYFPIEARFILAGVIGVVLLVYGWRLRERMRTLGLLLQGGGIGVLYVTVFAAARLHDLLPIGLALLVMIAMVLLSAVLAIVQNAKYLAIYGVTGGFLAPILTSTGGGNHILLFSYYALLNFGILAMAWYRSWRELNLIGFIFTFVIGLLWGRANYTPAHFASTEPFLILFFIYFVIIAVLFAVRQPEQRKGLVDGALVFGVPIIAFAMQTALVRDIEYGLALSALVVSAFYIALAMWLWRRAADGLRLLIESFLALGVIFGTLAIPFALDGHWTSAAWALEGAALVWVGVRQQRILARVFGVLVQLASGIAFLVAQVEIGHGVYWAPIPAGEWLAWNSTYLGATLISLAGLFSSYVIYRYRETLPEYDTATHIFLLIWGLSWWLAAGLREIIRHVDYDYRFVASLAFIAGSVLLLQRVERALQWRPAHYPVLGLIVVMSLLLVVSFIEGSLSHPFSHFGYFAWPAAFAVQFFVLYQYRKEVRQSALKFQHVLTYWAGLFLLSWEGTWWVWQATQGHTWRAMAWLLIPTLLFFMLAAFGRKLRWPFGVHFDWYTRLGGIPVAALLWFVALLFGLTYSGHPWPLDIYIPVLNPLDAAIAFVLLALLRWYAVLQQTDRISLPPAAGKTLAYLIGLLAFAWFNGMIARVIHHWLEVPYTLYALEKSVAFQTALSIFWTLLSLALMVIANRLRRRVLWFVGAALILVVVLKLFLVDLSNRGELVGIVSFIAVAILLILISRFAALPPRQQEGRS